MGVCGCAMFCCTLLYVHSSIAISLIGKRELVALLNLSSWWLVMVEWLFLAVPWGCLRFVIVVFPDHTHFLFLRHYLQGLLQQIVYFNKTVYLEFYDILTVCTSSPRKYFVQIRVESQLREHSYEPLSGGVYLTLNAPIATKVVCFSHLLKCLRSLYGKQCGPRSDCSFRSSLFWVQAVCFYTLFVSYCR